MKVNDSHQKMPSSLQGLLTKDDEGVRRNGFDFPKGHQI